MWFVDEWGQAGADRVGVWPRSPFYAKVRLNAWLEMEMSFMRQIDVALSMLLLVAGLTEAAKGRGR